MTDVDKADVRRKSTPIKVWVLPDEKRLIEVNAQQHGLSTSAFLRKVGMGFTATSVLDQQSITQLAKVNGDQGRLGGLLKLWLTNDERLQDMDVARITSLLQLIYQAQEELLEKVRAL